MPLKPFTANSGAGAKGDCLLLANGSAAPLPEEGKGDALSQPRQAPCLCKGISESP